MNSKRIRLTRIIEKEDDIFTAYSEELGLAASGHSFEEANRRLDKAIALVFKAATEKKEIGEFLTGKNLPIYSRDTVLREIEGTQIHGFRLKPGQWASLEYIELTGVL